MTKINNSVSNLLDKAIIDIFETHYPRGRMSKISLDDIPILAMNRFEGYSCRFIPPYSYVERDFEKSFMITDNSNMKTYVVTQDKRYADDGRKRVEKQVYLFAMDNSDITLHSEIRFDITDPRKYFKDKPFVGYTGCDDDTYYYDEVMQKVWISNGIEQILMMNALSHAFFGLPIHSDTLLCSHEKPLWNELSRRNLVQNYFERENHSEEGIMRYSFANIPKFYKHINN